jgi:translation initiation factor 2B subunit (eIF-2B alpha/beta/delta family)
VSATDLQHINEALDAAVRQVRADREHGASWIARLVARSLHDAADAAAAWDEDTCANLLALLHQVARQFAEARPSMSAVANAAARVWAAAASGDSGARDALDRLQGGARRILNGERAWALAIRNALRPLVTGPVFTLSRSGTVERALTELVPDLPDAAREIHASESRPGGEGVATARVLAATGWRVTLVADAAVGSFVSQARVAIVGADSVRADGSVVNKVGTYTLALAAREANVPLYAVCETLKIAAPDFPLVFEEMDPAELLPQPVAGVTPRNVYFDRTPADLIAGIVTELGVLSRDAIAREAEAAAHALTVLQHP